MPRVSLAVGRFRPPDNASGKRAMLLHGMTGGFRNWWRLGPYLAAKGYDVFAPDFRGHGQSSRADSYTLEEYADDLPKGPFDLVIGHSWGTTVAIYVAATQGLEFARQIVLIDPVMEITADDHDGVMQQQLREVAETTDQIRSDNPRWPSEDVEAKFEMAGLVDRQAVIKSFEQNRPLDVRNEARRVQVPVVAICADVSCGTCFPLSHEEDICTANKHWRVMRIADAGHSPHRDDWDAFAQALDTVL